MTKRIVNSVQDFAQYDTRWAKKGYKTAPRYIMQRNGCGATSCADIIASHPNHRNMTPEGTREYMIAHGYAVDGHGTAHAGIPACLKAYGFSVKYQPYMTNVFAEMQKGKRRAVFLMNNRVAPSGIRWTSNGHFVAVKGYEYDGKNHYFYVCDPGGRRHDGKFCYERDMKNCVVKVWTCYVPSTTIVIPKLPKRGYFKEGDKGLQVKRLQKMLNRAGYSCGKEYGTIGDHTLNAIYLFKHAYGLSFPYRFGKKALNRLIAKVGM